MFSKNWDRARKRRLAGRRRREADARDDRWRREVKATLARDRAERKPDGG
jgi:hypothetical protein